MLSEDDVVRAADTRFYDAIEQILIGGDPAAMSEAWHHTDAVTSRHPSGDWANGWQEVWALWAGFVGFGRADRGGSRVLSRGVHVYGDVAYTTVVFVCAPAFGGDTLNCTNILQRLDGAWKVIHHHADVSPSMGAALEKIMAAM
jgi:ketosteroid isomerase-like protein